MLKRAVLLAFALPLVACGPARLSDLEVFEAVLFQGDPHVGVAFLELRYDVAGYGCLDFGETLSGQVNGDAAPVGETGQHSYLGHDLRWHETCNSPRLTVTHPDSPATPLRIELTDGASVVATEVTGLGARLDAEQEAPAEPVQAGSSVTLVLGAGWQHVASFGSLVMENEGTPRQWFADPEALPENGRLTVPIPPEITPGRVTVSSRILPTRPVLLECEGAPSCTLEVTATTALEAAFDVIAAQ